MLLEGTDLPLWGLEVDPEEGRAEFAAQSKAGNIGGQAQDFLKGMGLGMVADQLADLKLGELLDTPPPGLDEAVAIAKVVQFVDSQVGGGGGGGEINELSGGGGGAVLGLGACSFSGGRVRYLSRNIGQPC